MILYFATPDLQIIQKLRVLQPNRKPNILLSYGSPNSYTDDFLFSCRTEINSVVLDSGTWTLNCTKKKNNLNITFSGYKDYLKQFGHLFDFYFNFDEDFSQSGFFTNNRNQLCLENAGLKPIPVIHNIYGKEVDYYIEHGYDFVASGSSQNSSQQNVNYISSKLYQHNIKLHLFGTTRLNLLSEFPVYSCDSSTWTKNASFIDAIMYWNHDKQGVDKKDIVRIETRIDACR